MFANQEEQDQWRESLVRMNRAELHAAAVGQFTALHVLTRLLQSEVTRENVIGMLQDFEGSFKDVQGEQRDRHLDVTPFPVSFAAWNAAQEPK